MRLDAESRLSPQVDLGPEPTEHEVEEDDFVEQEQTRAPVTLQAITRPRPLQEAVANKPSHYRTAPAPTQYTLEEIQRHSEDKAFAKQLSEEFKKHGCSVIKPGDRLPFAMLMLNTSSGYCLPHFSGRTQFAVALISDKSLHPQDRMLLATKCAEQALFRHNRDELKVVATQMKNNFPGEYQDFVQQVNDGASRNWVRLVSWFATLGSALPSGRVPTLAVPFAMTLGMAVGLVVVPPGLLVVGLALGFTKLIRTNDRIDNWARGFESRFSDPRKTTKLLDELNAGKLA